MGNIEDLDRAATQLLALESVATPGPWKALDKELYFGPDETAPHQSLDRVEDAALVAVARSWLRDLATEYLRLRQQQSPPLPGGS